MNLDDKKILYCDLLYDENGHFDDDYKLLNSFCNNRLVHYKKNIVNMNFFERKRVFKTIFSSNLDKIIASTSYVHLFIASLLYNTFDYILQVHFVPLNHKQLYKFLFLVFVKKCKRIVVLSDAVKDSLIDIVGDDYSEKVSVIHTRVVELVDHKPGLDKIVVSVVGAVSIARNYDIIFDALKSERYNNIIFNIHSFGIKKYLQERNIVIDNNVINITDKYLDEHEYQQSFCNSDYTIISHSSLYGVRFSGVMFDSLNGGAAIIANNNSSFTKFIEVYKCGYVFSGVDSLIGILKKINNNVKRIEKFDESLYSDYSVINNRSLALDGYLLR